MEEAFQPGLVSVIIPTYNRAQFLIEAMQSVFDQTYRPIEMIVVDDGSDDGTDEMVKKWWAARSGATGFELKYIIQNNMGACVARNRGLQESQGEFIQFLDSDDLLYPQKIRLQIEILQASRQSDFVYSITEYIDDDSSSQEKRCIRIRGYDATEFDTANLFYAYVTNHFFSGNAAIYTRNLCRRVGPWEEDAQRAQDWEFNARVILAKPVFKYLPSALSCSRCHSQGRISDSFSDVAQLLSVVEVYRGIEKKLHENGLMITNTEKAFCKKYLSFMRIAIRLSDLDLSRSIYNSDLKHQNLGHLGFKGFLWTRVVMVPGCLCILIGRIADAIFFNLRRIKKLIKKCVFADEIAGTQLWY